MDVDFRPLTLADVSAATELSTAAGWSMRAADWERLVTLTACRTVGGWDGDRLVATASVVCYGHAVAWIGSVIVADSHRRQGLGTRVFDAAHREATAGDVELVGLDANDMGRPIYERAGYEPVLTATVFSGTPQRVTVPDSIVPLTDVDQIASYDADALDLDRRALLRAILSDPRTAGFTTTDEAGYAIYAPTRQGWAVGPLLADERETAHSLLAAVSNALNGHSITVNALGRDAADLFSDAGLTSTRTLTRMTYPSPRTALFGPLVHANAGFALG